MINSIPYKGFFIYEKNGKYTVGGENSASFDDCTLKTLERCVSVNEFAMVKWLKHNSGKVFLCLLDGCRGYFSDIDNAKLFIDWLVECQQYHNDVIDADTSDVISEADEEFERFKEEIVTDDFTVGRYFEDSDYEDSYTGNEITASKRYLLAKIEEFLHLYYPNEYIVSDGDVITVRTTRERKTI